MADEPENPGDVGEEMDEPAASPLSVFRDRRAQGSLKNAARAFRRSRVNGR